MRPLCEHANSEIKSEHEFWLLTHYGKEFDQNFIFSFFKFLISNVKKIIFYKLKKIKFFA